MDDLAPAPRRGAGTITEQTQLKNFRETLARTLHHNWWWAPLLVVVAGGLCFVGAEMGKPYYVRWRSARALAQAQSFLRAHDLPRASVALQVALHDQPTLQVYQLLGDLDEAAGIEQAVAARRLAAQASPSDSRLKLDFARTALRFNDLGAAREALASLGQAEPRTREARKIEASYALLAGEWAHAARLLATLKAEDPSDTGVRFLADSLAIRSADEKQAGAASADLRLLADVASQRLPALRVLLADALRRGNSFAAEDAGRALTEAPGATLGDLLDSAAADVLVHRSGGIDQSLNQRIRTQAATSAPTAARYGRWLLREKRPEEAEAWFAQLPIALRKTPAVAEVEAEIATAQEDWDRLRLLLRGEAWGPIVNPGIDFAFAARILRQRGQLPLATDTWANAISQSANSESTLRVLARLADIWRWPDGMQKALFATVQNYPNDQVAIDYLTGLLRVRRDTHGLLNLLALRKAAGSLTDRQMADWAYVTLLVNPRAKPDDVMALLDGLYERNPRDAYIATDHALELWELGRIRDACAVADRLSPDDRSFGGRAPCLAVIYASAGRLTDAQIMISRAPRSAELWPEEADLIERATAVIRR